MEVIEVNLTPGTGGREGCWGKHFSRAAMCVLLGHPRCSPRPAPRSGTRLGQLQTDGGVVLFQRMSSACSLGVTLLTCMIPSVVIFHDTFSYPRRQQRGAGGALSVLFRIFHDQDHADAERFRLGPKQRWAHSKGWGARMSWRGPEAGVCWRVKEVSRAGAGCWRERAQECHGMGNADL